MLRGYGAYCFSLLSRCNIIDLRTTHVKLFFTFLRFSAISAIFCDFYFLFFSTITTTTAATAATSTTIQMTKFALSPV